MKFKTPQEVFTALQKAGKIKEREEQVELSTDLYETFTKNNYKAFVAESPTGTGKSLAVLVAAAIHALKKKDCKIVKNGEITDSYQTTGKTLIATPSWNLQKQYKEEFEKFIEPLFEGKVKLSIIKGKTGYINRAKLVNAINEEKNEDKKSLLKSILTLADGVCGDIEEMIATKPDLANIIDKFRINYDDEEPQEQRFYYFNIAKNNAKESDIIVTNHAFFCYYSWYKLLSEQRDEIFKFTTKEEESIVFEVEDIPFYIDAVVGDEAHKLERSIINTLSDQIVISTIVKTIEEASEILDKTTKKTIRKQLWDIRKEIDKISQGLPDKVLPITDPKISQILSPIYRLYEFLLQIKQKRNYKNLKATLRNKIQKIVSTFNVIFGLYAKFLTSQHTKGENLKAIHKKIIEEFKHFTDAKLRNLNVLYVKFSPEKRKPSLVIMPPYVKGSIFNIQKIYSSIVLLSEALRDVNVKALEYQFEEIINCLGISKFQVKQKVYKGYNLREMVKLYLYPDIPRPDISVGIVEEEIVKGIIEKSKKTLILTPSHFETKKWEKVLLDLHNQIKLFTYTPQNTQSLNSIISEFESEKKAVLVTASAWEEVDIEGLNTLIITRIPFRSYLDPLFIARETFRQLKGEKKSLNHVWADNVFETFIQLRQGMGRLIRKETDKGEIHLLDSRINDYKKWKEFFERTYSVVEVKK